MPPMLDDIEFDDLAGSDLRAWKQAEDAERATMHSRERERRAERWTNVGAGMILGLGLAGVLALFLWLRS